MRRNKGMTDERRLNYLKEYLNSSLSKYQFEKEKGLFRHSLSEWFRKFGVEDKSLPLNDSEMKKEVSPREQELLEQIRLLKQEVKKLKVELVQSNMARDAYDCMIDLAESTYNIKVRKNSNAK